MDPRGGHGRRRGPALRAPDPYATRPLGVLLLPRPLERFVLRAQATDLLRAPGVVAIEPARVSYEAYLRLPAGIGDGIAAVQARRLQLPGTPRAVLIFGALQYPLARALLFEHPGCQLWYAPEDTPPDSSRGRRERLEELHLAAAARAAVTPAIDELLAGERFPPSLWAWLEGLGIESGRLGSERIS